MARAKAQAPAQPPPAPVSPDGLSARAMLVDLSVKRWKGAMRDKEVSQEVADQHDADVEMGHFYKRLVSKEAMDRLTKIETAANHWHRQHTLPWLDTGVRVLLSAGYFDYTEQMAKWSDDWDAAKRDFVSNYALHRAEAQGRLGTLYRDEDYPHPNELDALFRFGYRVTALPDSGDFRVELADGETDRIKAKIAAEQTAQVEVAAAEVRGRIVEVVKKLAEHLRAYKVEVTPDGKRHTTGSLHPSLTANVAELADILPALNIKDDPALVALADEMRGLTEFDPKVLRESEDRRQEIADKADAIYKQMEGFVT